MDKKEFIIQINGVKESITEVDELLSKLSNLQERLDKLQNATISVNVDAAEFPKVLPTSEEENPPTATTAELMKQIEAAKELKQVHKEIAQGARDENGEYTNTLKGLRAQLSEMKKQLSLTELGTSAFDEMNKKVGSLNSEVKKLEQSYGDFQRNVGNYASAAEGFNQITVSVGGAEKSFSSLKSANKELQNEMNNLALRMKELQDSGQGASEEFEELSARFEDAAKASESLDKATAYANRMKESIQDDSGAIGEMSRSFEAFNAVANIGIGVLGLFGSETEDLQKNINRTIQVTTVLKGIQELYNSQLQKGAPLMKAYQGAVNLVEKALYRKAAAQTADVAATNAATTATHTFSKALVATGIGAIVVAIGLLIANLDTLSEWFTKLVGGADNLSKGLDKIKEVASGVGNAIVNFIVQPFKTSMAVINKIMEGDLKGAVTEYTEGIKKQYNVVAAYQEGAQKQAEKNQENHNKEMAKKRAKDTQNAIEENEAKYGSDWKYTEEANELYQQMFSDRLSMYDKDSEEYRQANNEKLAYDREYAKKQTDAANKAAQEAEKKRQDGIRAAQDYQKKLDEINERIYKNELELIRDTYEKKKRELEHQREKELKEAKASAEKVNEQVAAINNKYNKQLADNEEKRLQSQVKAREAYNKNIVALSNSTASIQLKDIDVKNDVERWRKNLLAQITNGFIEPLDKDLGEGITDVFDRIESNLERNLERLSSNAQKIKDLNEEINKGEGKAIDIEVRYNVSNSLNQMGDNIKSFLDSNNELITNSLNDSLKKITLGLSEMKETASKTTFENVFSQIDKLEDVYKTLSKTIDEFIKDGGDGSEELAQMLSNLNQNIGSQLTQNISVFANTNQRFLDEERQSVEEHNKIVVDSITTAYDQLKNVQEKLLKVDFGNDGGFEIVNLAEIAHQQKAMSKLSESYNTLTKAIDKQIKIAEKENQDQEENFRHYETEQAILWKYIGIRERINELEDKRGSNSLTKEESKELNNLNKKASEYEKTLKELDKDQNEFNRSISIKQLKDYSKQFDDSKQSIKKTIDINNSYMSSLAKLADDIKKFQKGSEVDWREWAQTIAGSFAEIGSAASTIMNNIAETMYNNATKALEEQLEALEDETEAYEDKYQEDYDALEESLRAQEDLVAEHNDIINSLEGELASARGDRRLEVLDAITSEKAEREKALKKQKQLEKQRQQMEKQKAEFDKQQEEKKLALEKQMDEEELKRKKLQKISQLVQATINTGVGVTQALASGPPYISIPMAAIISAMGTAEIAMIASQKYASGGLLVGNSHQNGGVKVLGGQAEVEGGEYITNKRTTKYNLELLDFINSQNGRIDESDILEFFSKKHTPKYSFNQTVFASGGQLPNLTNPQSINQQRVIKTMNMDASPIVVSVQEIVDVADNMRQVRVLSGEDDDFGI